MKRLFSFVLIVLMLSFAGCGKKDGRPTDTQVQSSNVSSPLQSDIKADASEYSVEKEDLLGTWKLCYYSYDNEEYKDYSKDISDVASYSFYPDETAVLRNSESDETVYRYTLPENQKGNIVFYDSVSGQAAPFFFGYGIVDNESGRYLIISKYNSSEETVTYYILREVI